MLEWVRRISSGKRVRIDVSVIVMTKGEEGGW